MCECLCDNIKYWLIKKIEFVLAENNLKKNEKQAMHFSSTNLLNILSLRLSLFWFKTVL